MTLEEFKKIIESKDIPKGLYILKYSDNDYIPYQYIDFIKKNTDYEVEFISNASELITNTFDIFGSENSSNSIKILKEETFDFNDPRLVDSGITFVVCKKVSKIVEDTFKDYIINITKLEQWQIEDYAYSIAEGVDEKSLKGLVELCNNNIFRLSQELDKIRIFPKEQRAFIYQKFLEDDIFSDLSAYTIFTFTTALVKRDIKGLFKAYTEIKNIDVEPIGLLILLCQNFKDIINVQLSVNSSPEALGMKNNKYWAIKYSCGFYTKEELMSIYKFLTGLDKSIKVGEMPMEYLVDYIILKVITCGY